MPAPGPALQPDLDSRYASAAEVSELKAQLNSLLQAYDQLVTRYNTQSSRLLELERNRGAVPAAADRHRVLRSDAMPGSY
ncbi:hypothetical protein B0919_23315 [Hymenobacter sp. CRA2]|nr:hypothetical protein B0919_23315 [Hymenobacter sp. CRA2]